MSLVYICVPSANVYNEMQGTIKGSFLKDLAFLQQLYKNDTFVSVSLYGFSIVPYLDKNADISYNAWKHHCEALMRKSDALFVLMYHDWQMSFGVSEEIKFGVKHGIPVYYIDMK